MISYKDGLEKLAALYKMRDVIVDVSKEFVSSLANDEQLNVKSRLNEIRETNSAKELIKTLKEFVDIHKSFVDFLRSYAADRLQEMLDRQGIEFFKVFLDDIQKMHDSGAEIILCDVLADKFKEANDQMIDAVMDVLWKELGLTANTQERIETIH
ncbi:MAG: hypothetical protein ACREA5_03690 [Nitrosotalea sp.]